jgi:hypothetical protein
LDSSEGNRFQIWIALDDFVRDPPQRAANSFRVHDRDGGSRRSLFCVLHCIPWRPHGIALKEQKN